MNEDFFYALITAWSILLIFWTIIVVFIAIRKPPKSKLSNKLMVYSFLLFLIILFVLLSAYTDSFFFYKFNYFFGEDQARYLIEIRKENLNKVDKLLKENSVHYDELGYVIDNNIEFSDEIKLSVDEIEKTYKSWLRRYMVN